jgi:hypothetical protein
LVKAVAMSHVVTVPELLDGHTVLDIECPDRIYLNGYVPTLQVGGQVLTFLRGHPGMPVASPAVFEKIGTRFRQAVARFAQVNDIPVIRFRKGIRKIDVMQRYCAALRWRDGPGWRVLAEPAPGVAGRDRPGCAGHRGELGAFRRAVREGCPGKRLRGAFPQARLLALAECRTRALIAAACGACATGEKTLTAAAGAQLLRRTGVSFALPAGGVLAGGTYLPVLKAPRHLRRHGAAGIIARVIEYRLQDAAGEVTLITTLTGPGTAPARELAELYHARWQIETAPGAFRSEMKGSGVALRSRTPDGAGQEIRALLCACHAIREMICAAAAPARQDPLRISFASAPGTVRSPAGNPGAFPP